MRERGAASGDRPQRRPFFQRLSGDHTRFDKGRHDLWEIRASLEVFRNAFLASLADPLPDADILDQARETLREGNRIVLIREEPGLSVDARLCDTVHACA